MAQSTASFSSRPQHTLEFNLNDGALGASTKTFSYSARMTTSGNTLRPWASGITWQVRVVSPSVQKGTGTWSYDFRSPTSLNATFSIGSGSFTINRTSSDAYYNITFSSGSAGLIGSASATIQVFVPGVSTTYTASYNGNGSTSGSTASTQYTNPPSTSGTVAFNGFSRSGYDFNGWNTAANGSGTSYSQGASFTGNITLYAQWSPSYVPTPAPGTPSGLSVSDQTTSRIVLNWSGSSGSVNGYYLFRNGTNVGSVGAATRSYSFTGLSPNTTYTLGVAAYGPDYSSSTATISGSTLPVTFSTPSVVGQSQSVGTNLLTSAGFGSVTPTLINVGATASNNLLIKAQSPVGGTTATSGDSASIDVYNYLIATPNILGLSQIDANTALTNATFTSYSSSFITSGATVSNNLKVAAQNPTGGTFANPLSTVTFTIYNFLTAVPNVIGLGQDAALTALANLGFTSITTTRTDVGVTPQNAGTIKEQTPVNSGTTYNPKNQSVSLVVYSLGITGKRYSGTSNSMVQLSTSKRFDGTNWVQTTVAKRYDGTQWKDIVN